MSETKQDKTYHLEVASRHCRGKNDAGQDWMLSFGAARGNSGRSFLRGIVVLFILVVADVACLDSRSFVAVTP